MADVYEIVNEKILAELDKGIIPWKKPWKSVYAVSYVTRKPYSLLNQILLNDGGEYLTFNQITSLGGHIKKGAKAKFVVFWKMLKKTETVEEDGETKTVTRVIPMLRYYNVFNIKDTEGVKPHTEITTEEIKTLDTADEVITVYISRENIGFHFGGNSAFYSPSLDSVTVPEKSQFMETAEYYSTVFHELVHSTGHESRLNRGLKGAFGSKEYSKEELVAELGSAYSLGRLGIDTQSSTRNSTAYIQSWKKHISEDKYLFVSTAGKAEKACKYIFGEVETAEEVGE